MIADGYWGDQIWNAGDIEYLMPEYTTERYFLSLETVPIDKLRMGLMVIDSNSH